MVPEESAGVYRCQASISDAKASQDARNRVSGSLTIIGALELQSAEARAGGRQPLGETRAQAIELGVTATAGDPGIEFMRVIALQED